MQAEGLQHAADGKLGQGCSSRRSVGIVAVRTAYDHSQT